MFDLKKYQMPVIFVSILLVVIGFFSLQNVNTRLLPDMKLPEIGLATTWSGKSIEEVEKSLVIPLEQELKSVSSVKNIVSWVEKGKAWTTITFQTDTDMRKAYSEVQSKINQVPNWPLNAAKPLIFDFSAGANATLASFYLHGEKTAKPQDFIRVFKDEIEPSLMSVKGVSAVKVPTQSIRERLNIIFNEQKLVDYKLTIDDVIESLEGLYDASGDEVNLGKRSYQMVFKGEMPLDNLEQHIVKAKDFHLIKLSDIATIEMTTEDDWSPTTFNGQEALFFFVQPSQKIDVLPAIAEIKEKLAEINDRISSEHGFKVDLRMDDSKAISESISFIKLSTVIGSLLAGVIVFVFIRDIKSVALILLSVPFSLAVVFTAMWAADKEMHLISLAGISLAVGLIVDAAIITMESVQKSLRGDSLASEILAGIENVKSALISSTLTSVIIFIPILLISTKEGQLFEDLAFVISIALIASLFYSLMVLPSLSNVLNIRTISSSIKENTSSSLWIPIKTVIGKLENKKISTFTFVVISVLGVVTVLFFRPEFDVLPDPKVEDVTVYVSFEKGLSNAAMKSLVTGPINDLINESIEEKSAPLFDYYTHRCVQRGCFLNFVSSKNTPIEEYENWLVSDVFEKVVGTEGFPERESLLSLALPNHRATEVDFIGNDVEQLTAVASGVMDYLYDNLEGAQVFENSELVKRDVYVEFNHFKEKLAYSDFTTQHFNNYLVAMSYGYYIGDFYNNGKSVSTYVKGEKVSSVDDLLQRSIVTPNEEIRKVGDLTKADMKPASSLIMRVNNAQVSSLYIEAPEGVPMGRFVKDLKSNIADYMNSKSISGVAVQYRGSSNDMGTFLADFSKILSLSVIILFGLLCWFTRSVWASVVVMLSLPISMAGGLLSLYLFSLFRPQNLDMITIIGFIMLMGLVINNGILLVSSFTSKIEEGMSKVDSILASLSHRKRAILLSTLTSILGMLPLLNPTTTSSEIYQGLAVVIIGGMMTNISLGLLTIVALLYIFDSRQP